MSFQLVKLTALVKYKKTHFDTVDKNSKKMIW